MKLLFVQFFQPPIPSSILVPNILLGILFLTQSMSFPLCDRQNFTSIQKNS